MRKTDLGQHEVGTTSLPDGNSGLAVRQVAGKWTFALAGYGSEETWVEVEDPAEEWQGVWFRVNFRPSGEIAAFAICLEPGKVLKARKVQRVRVREVELVARRFLREWHQLRRGDDGESMSYDGGDQRRDLWLAEIARAYVQTVGTHDWRSQLGKKFGIGFDYVPDLIGEIRNKRGLLTKTLQGRAGGLLTARAHALLAGIESGDPVDLCSLKLGVSKEHAASLVHQYESAGILDAVAEDWASRPTPTAEEIAAEAEAAEHTPYARFSRGDIDHNEFTRQIGGPFPDEITDDTPGGHDNE